MNQSKRQIGKLPGLLASARRRVEEDPPFSQRQGSCGCSGWEACVPGQRRLCGRNALEALPPLYGEGGDNCEAPWEKRGWLMALAWGWLELGARPRLSIDGSHRT